MSAAHILVVDDEADIRGLLKEILSEEGYDVDVAAHKYLAGRERYELEPAFPHSVAGTVTDRAHVIASRFILNRLLKRHQ